MSDGPKRTASGCWSAAGRTPDEFARLRLAMIERTRHALEQYRAAGRLEASDETLDAAARVAANHCAALAADVVLAEHEARRR